MEKKKDRRLIISRRTFLQASGATGLTVLAATKLPRIWKRRVPSAPAPPPPEGVVTEKWVNTSCLNCPARCGTRVRVVNGKAVRIAGNPLSLASDGEICPRGHIGLQVLYDPERLKQPLKRTNQAKGRGTDPMWVTISWDEAISELTGRLQTIRNSGHPERVAIFSGLNVRSDEDLVSRFAQAYGTPNLFYGDGLENEAEKTGRWLADGNYAHVSYDLGRSSYVLAFGASIVESERPLAPNLRRWGKMRRENPTRAKVVVIDPRYSITAAKADRWLPIKPGTDGALALSIANVIIGEGLYDRQFVSANTTGFEDFRAAVLNHPPESVSGITGISADVIRQIAREFAGTKAAVAWVGRGVAGWPNGTLTCYAVFCLNALVGAIDSPGGVVYQVNPEYKPMPAVSTDAVAKTGMASARLDASGQTLFDGQSGGVNRVPDAILKGQPYSLELGIGVNANFNMVAPATARWDNALGKLPYYVHIAPFVSEMALFADLVIPSTTFLEQWGYDHSCPGVGFAEVRIKQPVVESLTEGKSVADAVFEVSRKLGGSVAAAFDGIGNDAQSFVRLRTESITPWSDFLAKGVWVGSAYRYGKYDGIFKTPSRKFEFVSSPLKDIDRSLSSVTQTGLPRYSAPGFVGDEIVYPFVLTTYQPLLTLENGSQNYPWAQEIFLVMHGVGWTNFAEMNRNDAEKLGIGDGHEIWVESSSGRLKARARVTEWIHPGCVAMARGQGHYAPGEWQKGIGVNPHDIVGVAFDNLSGQSAMYNTRVTVYRA